MVTKIVVSGSKVSQKQSASIAVLLSSVKSLWIQPAKGKNNPEHIQHNLPPSLAKKIKKENEK